MNCSMPGSPCPSLSPGVDSNSYPLSPWCYLTISFSAVPLSFCFNLSQHPGLFQWAGTSHQVTKVLALQLHPQSFQMNIQGWLLAVQVTLKSLLQPHNSKASILHHSAFFVVQLSHLYMTTGKTIALTIWTFVGKMMSLLFNMLFRLACFPRS